MKLIRDCKDLYGDLSENNKEVLSQLLSAQDNDTWEIARRIVVSPAPLLTLDMAVARVQEQKESGCPDPFTIYRALDYAVKRHQHYLNRPKDKELGLG